jgi:hypothetical protein
MAMVQKAFDRPYDELPAPSKIPAGALEFNISAWARLNTSDYLPADAVCEVKWKNGANPDQVFVSADDNTGWFRFDNTPGVIVASSAGTIISLSGRTRSQPDSMPATCSSLGIPPELSFLIRAGLSTRRRGGVTLTTRLPLSGKTGSLLNNRMLEYNIHQMPQYNSDETAPDVSQRGMKDGFDKSL